MPKRTTEEEIKKTIERFEKDREKKHAKKGNAAKFFGVNPSEVDGLSFQKKVRKEWD